MKKDKKKASRGRDTFTVLVRSNKTGKKIVDEKDVLTIFGSVKLKKVHGGAKLPKHLHSFKCHWSGFRAGVELKEVDEVLNASVQFCHNLLIDRDLYEAGQTMAAAMKKLGTASNKKK